MFRSLLLTGFVGLLAAGCGGSERWVMIPMMGCPDLEEAQKDPDFPKLMEQEVGPSQCREAGGLQYAGDVRCDGDRVQVLCEEP